MLNNQNVLYIVIALAIFCSLGYLCVSSYECLAVFVIVFFISCNFVKNKVICILIALFVSNFVFGCTMSLKGSLFEGYSNPNFGPVNNPALAFTLEEVVEVAGAVAGEASATAAAKQGAGPETQQKERKSAEQEAKKKVIEQFY